MARVRTKMPKVFIGHPFSGRFPVSKFRGIFRELPFEVIYGDTHLQTKQLLHILKSHIRECDYAIFDLSDWNSNVALELGLAEGIGRSPNKKYYILLNTRRSKEVPSDVRGIQRIEYTSYDYSQAKGLGYQLIYSILKKESLIKKIEKSLVSDRNIPKKMIIALKILGHLREYDSITNDNIKSLRRGTRLRNTDEILAALENLKIIKKNGKSWTISKSLYKTTK